MSEPVTAIPSRPGRLMSVVARNSAFVLGSQIVIKGLAFLFNVFVVRRLGDVHFGRYSAVMAYIQMFSIFSDLGMAPYVLREIARDRERIYDLLPNIVSLRLILSAIVVAGVTTGVYLLGKGPDIVLGVLIAGLSLFLYAFQGPLETVLMAWERLDLMARYMVVNQIVFWSTGTLFLLAGFGYRGLLVAMLLGITSMALLSGRSVGRTIRLKDLKVNRRLWWPLLVAGLPFGISGLSFVVETRFDMAFMSFVLNDATVGWYAVACNLSVVMMPVAQSVCTSMYPTLVREYSLGVNPIGPVIAKTLKYLLLISLPIAVGGTLVSGKLIPLLYTNQFAPAIPLFALVIWDLPAFYITELTGPTCLVLQMEKQVARVNVLSALIHILLDIALILTLGTVGAAIAEVSARWIRVGLHWWLLGTERLTGGQWQPLLRVLLSALGMGAAVFLVRHMHLLVMIGVGVIAYLMLILVTRAVEPQELRQIAQMILRRGGSEHPRISDTTATFQKG
ncbi:MAG: flippase [Anaerolineae bacterium]|nr:flippase [Anaerolineae bacterium]